ncbi:MAG: rod shape-determining protein MreD [Rhodobacteraceae bacterium]|nr:MAG: rod shape-determining protein MreD [Paracoccaceae bacterium]
MVERRHTKRLIFMALFLFLAALMTFYRLLPTGGYGFDATLSEEERLVAAETVSLWTQMGVPDLLLCLTMAWVLRRPDLLPAPLIAGYFLLEDILLLRPPGLWAMIVLMGSEFLRRHAAQFRSYRFFSEFLLVAGLFVAMWLADRAVLAIVMVPQPALGLSFVHLLGTIAIYPAIVAISRFVFGLRKPATGELDALGQKL